MKPCTSDCTDPLGGPGIIVEADETFVGGKARNRAFRKPAPKKAVMTLVERDGRARSFHVAKVNAATLRGVLVANVDRASTLSTDDLPGLLRLAASSKRTAVTHKDGEYAATKTIPHIWTSTTAKSHSNTAENFFSIFKRGVIGTYHHLSEAHLHRYCREFDLRYDTRDMTDAERAGVILKGMEGKRLTYRSPSQLAA